MHLKLLCLMSLTTLAQAAPVYKVIDADGHVTYSSEAPPAQTGRAVEIITPAPGPNENRVNEAAAREVQLDDAAQNADRQLEQRRAQRAERTARLREAEAALAKAQKAYADGQDPEPGERVGTVRQGANGKTVRGSRLSDAYQQRVKALEEAVKAAEAAAVAARRQLRDSP